MGRRAVLGAVLGGGCLLLALLMMSPDSSRPGRAAGPTTSAGPGASVAPSSVSSPRGQAVGQVLPPGTVVRSGQVVKTGAADYEMFTADGPGGTFEVTLYNRFDPDELDGIGLRREPAPGGVLWVEDERPEATSVYYLSSGGIGLGIANRTAATAAPVATLGGMAQRLAQLVAAAGP